MNKISDLFNICVSMPNMGSFIFYIIFVILTPIFLLAINQESNIVNYLPLIVPLAIIMHTVGEDKVFQNLYPKNRDNPVGTTSKYILNILAIIAILYKVTLVQQQSNEVLAVVVGIINIGLIFLVAPLVMPPVIEKVDQKVKGYGWETHYDWHKYTVGFLMLVLLVVLEIVGCGLAEMIIL